jgi:hypothetical protein
MSVTDGESAHAECVNSCPLCMFLQIETVVPFTLRVFPRALPLRIRTSLWPRSTLAAHASLNRIVIKSLSYIHDGHVSS